MSMRALEPREWAAPIARRENYPTCEWVKFAFSVKKHYLHNAVQKLGTEPAVSSWDSIPCSCISSAWTDGLYEGQSCQLAWVLEHKDGKLEISRGKISNGWWKSMLILRALRSPVKENRGSFLRKWWKSPAEAILTWCAKSWLPLWPVPLPSMWYAYDLPFSWKIFLY